MYSTYYAFRTWPARDMVTQTCAINQDSFLERKTRTDSVSPLSQVSFYDFFAIEPRYTSGESSLNLFTTFFFNR